MRGVRTRPGPKRKRVHHVEPVRIDPVLKAQRDLGFWGSAENMIKVYAEDSLRSAITTISKFNGRYAEDPLDAFRWADDAVRAAAKHRASRLVLELLERGYIASRVESYFAANVRSGITTRYNSTSPCSNIAEHEEFLANVSTLETIRRALAQRDNAVALIAEAEMYNNL